MLVASLGQGDLKQGRATHSCILAWRIPWTQEPVGLQSIGSQSQTPLKWFSMHRTFSNTILKKNSKWIGDLTVILETIQLLEENIGRTFFDINWSNFFFDLSPKEKQIKAKINKWDLIKLKTFTQQKKPPTKQKDNLLNGRKYLQNNMTDKVLIS